MERSRGSYVDDMLSVAMPVIEKILSMNSSEAVLNIQEPVIRKIDSTISGAYDDVTSYRNKDLIHQLLYWWKQWQNLKPLLAEGWNIQAARAQALAAMTYLKAIAEIHEEIRNRLKRESKLRYWPGTPMKASVRETLIEFKTNRSAAIKKLYQLIKQALLLENDYHKQEAVKDFFSMVAKADYKVAIPFLDVMGYEDREYKDLGILCVLNRCPVDHIKACFPLLNQFSSEQFLEEGIKSLFSNSVDEDPDLALMLIKKMPSRSLRNSSFGELAISYARKGDFVRAGLYAEMITSVVLKADIDKQIEAFKPDERPLIEVEDLDPKYKFQG